MSTTETTIEKQISDLIFAIAAATDAAQDAEDGERLARASKIRGQIREMEKELATLRAQIADAPPSAAAPTRAITVAIDADCALGGVPLLWGVAEGDDLDARVAARADAAATLGEGNDPDHDGAADGLDLVAIQWPATEPLPCGRGDDNDRAVRLGLAALESR